MLKTSINLKKCYVCRYNSSRAKCIKCHFCSVFFSPNKFVFHSHRYGQYTYAYKMEFLNRIFTGFLYKSASRKSLNNMEQKTCLLSQIDVLEFHLGKKQYTPFSSYFWKGLLFLKLRKLAFCVLSCIISEYFMFSFLLKLKWMGDSKRTNYRGPSLVGWLDSACRYNRLLSCLGCYCQSSTTIIFY